MIIQRASKEERVFIHLFIDLLHTGCLCVHISQQKKYFNVKQLLVKNIFETLAYQINFFPKDLFFCRKKEEMRSRIKLPASIPLIIHDIIHTHLFKK